MCPQKLETFSNWDLDLLSSKLWLKFKLFIWSSIQKGKRLMSSFMYRFVIDEIICLITWKLVLLRADTEATSHRQLVRTVRRHKHVFITIGISETKPWRFPDVHKGQYSPEIQPPSCDYNWALQTVCPGL